MRLPSNHRWDYLVGEKMKWLERVIRADNRQTTAVEREGWKIVYLGIPRNEGRKEVEFCAFQRLSGQNISNPKIQMKFFPYCNPLLKLVNKYRISLYWKHITSPRFEAWNNHRLNNISAEIYVSQGGCYIQSEKCFLKMFEEEQIGIYLLYL